MPVRSFSTAEADDGFITIHTVIQSVPVSLPENVQVLSTGISKMLASLFVLGPRVNKVAGTSGPGWIVKSSEQHGYEKRFRRGSNDSRATSVVSRGRSVRRSR